MSFDNRRRSLPSFLIGTVGGIYTQLAMVPQFYIIGYPLTIFGHLGGPHNFYCLPTRPLGVGDTIAQNCAEC